MDLGDKLDSVYLQLIEVYLIVGKSEEFHSVLSTLEQRLDEVADFSDRAFAMLNEIGQLLMKHGSDTAGTFFKKALLAIKRRYKANYKSHPMT